MKRYNKFTGKKILPVLVILLVFFILLCIFMVPNLGKWLIVVDELQESDMIVVLMGSVYDRILLMLINGGGIGKIFSGWFLSI